MTSILTLIHTHDIDRVVLRVEIARPRAIGSCEIIENMTENKSMKRTRAAAKIQQQHAIQENLDDGVVKLVKVQVASKVSIIFNALTINKC